MNTLAVIIPMYNEEANAARCVQAVCDVLKTQPGVRLYVVNDGSRDRTEEILRPFAAGDYPMTLVSYTPNRGYGGALLAGMRAAHAQGYVFGLFMDSDLTNDPALIARFSETLRQNAYDFVKASRYVSGGSMAGVPVHRRAFSILGNKVAALLFNMGIHDCTNGFHAVRLALLVNEEFRERGFPFLMEELLILKKKGARGTEIPYTLTARASAQGKSSFQYSAKMLWDYLKYALRAALVQPTRKGL